MEFGHGCPPLKSNLVLSPLYCVVWGVQRLSTHLHIVVAKVCELAAMELAVRAQFFTGEDSRVTLTADDIRRGARSTDVFDFLLDVLLEDG